MLGYSDMGNPLDWILRNETDAFKTVPLKYGANSSSTAHLAAACSGALYPENLKTCDPSPACKKDPSLNLFCFVWENQESTLSVDGTFVQFEVYDNVTSPGKLTIDECPFSCFLYPKPIRA